MKTCTERRNTKANKLIDWTKPIRRIELARALLQKLHQKIEVNCDELQATRLVVTHAIDKKNELKPMSESEDLFDGEMLFEWARNRQWRRSLLHLNALCVKSQPGNAVNARMVGMLGQIGEVTVDILPRDPEILLQRIHELTSERRELKEKNILLEAENAGFRKDQQAREAHRAPIIEKLRANGKRAWVNTKTRKTKGI